MGKQNSTQAGFDKQAAINQARADAFKAREPDDFVPKLYRVYCIINDRKEDGLTLKKWQEWVENAPEVVRRAWTKDAKDFAKWLYDAMISEAHSSDDPEAAGQTNDYITHALVALNELIFYIEGKISVDVEGYFLRPKSDGDTRPFFVLAMAAAKRKPSLYESAKGAWVAWKSYQEEYIKMHPDARNPLGASIEDYVSHQIEISPFKPKRRSQLPVWEKMEVGEARRLVELQTEPSDTQLFSEISEIQSPASPFWLLDLYRRGGGAANQQGRGAPWPMRLLIGGFLHTPIHYRDGRWHCFSLPTDDVIRWLRPDGWSQRKSRWEQFPKALEEVNRLGRISIPGAGRVQVFGVSVIPERPTDPFVEFIVRVPPSAAHGARIDWPRLCKYGTKSAPLYRAYLTACAFMHRSAKNCQPVTEVIGKPLLNADGMPIRKKGKIVRSETEFEPNPAVRYVKGLTKVQLTEAIGLDSTNRANQRETMKAFERMEDDGVIDLQTEGRGRYQKYFLFARNQWADAQAKKEAEGENRENR